MTGLDEAITGEELHHFFSKYGEIKSAKLAVDPQTSKSKCYGFVWFMNEESCKKAICDSLYYKSSLQMPYQCQLFQDQGVRYAQNHAQANGF